MILVDATLLLYATCSNPRLFERPLAVPEAWHRARAWLELPTVWTSEPTELHAEIIGRFLGSVASSPKLVSERRVPPDR